jgi:hypothetical protein
MDAVTLRLANADDGYALERLAQLDSRSRPPGPHLVAVREGRIDAAISLSTAELIADPFQRTAELCTLLRCHVRTMLGDSERAPAPTRNPRPALAAT